MMKVILVTGASSGIGFDAAEALARQGHRVYAAARRVERMEPLKAFGVVPLRMDVTDEASMEAGVKTILETEGRIDALVNNAGRRSLLFHPVLQGILALSLSVAVISFSDSEESSSRYPLYLA